MAFRSFFTTASAALLLMVPAAAPAQDVQIGARIGVNMSAFAGDNRLDSHRQGFGAGLLVDVGLTGPLRLETGLAWTQKGGSGTAQGFEGAIPTRVRLHYVQLPILLRFAPSMSGSVRPSLSAGPAISFEAGCTREQDPTDIFVTAGCEDEARTRTDWGMLVGAGLAFDVGRGAVVVDGRYDFGMRDLDPQLRTFNRTFGVSTAFVVPLAR